MTDSDSAKIQEWMLDLINLYETQKLELALQIQEQLQLQKKTHWWYHRQLRAAVGCIRVVRRKRNTKAEVQA